jgi:hypothetical protein
MTEIKKTGMTMTKEREKERKRPVKTEGPQPG